MAFTHIQHQGSLSSVTSPSANQQPVVHKSGTRGEVDRDWPVVFRCTPASSAANTWEFVHAVLVIQTLLASGKLFSELALMFSELASMFSELALMFPIVLA